MHTAFELKQAMFSINIDGAPGSREELLNWGDQDRLAVIAEAPFSALGAGLMIQLAITAFYDRPSKRRRQRPLYPDIFLLHVGGPTGLHHYFDFWPDHKEILVEASPQEVLRTVNHVGATHLLIPDKQPQAVTHRYKEPEAALDRLKGCFAYGPSGHVAAPDIEIKTTSPVPLRNYRAVLDPEAASKQAAIEGGNVATVLRTTPPAELEIIKAILSARRAEVPSDHPSRERTRARLEQADASGEFGESYRRVSTNDVLNMLHRTPMW